MYAFFLVLFALWKALQLLGKKHVPPLRERFGLSPPAPAPIWIHAVSVGEARAARPLIQRLRNQFPGHRILMTCSTRTGQQEALRAQIDEARILPLDFRWIMRRWVRAIQPDIFILMESDFWPNLLRALHENDTPLVLMNGKLSERSAKRFALLPLFARRLFSRFNTLCLQDELQQRRFLPLIADPSRLLITGNLKLDFAPEPVDTDQWRKKLGLKPNQPVITIASTHAPEEKQIVEALQPLYARHPDLVCFLAPRHPERFPEVQRLLPHALLWSQGKAGPLVLIDSMGQLPICYSLSQVAIVGGTFVSHIGGHNLFEPCLYGAFSLFGPHLFSQPALLQKVTEAGTGKQVNLSELATEIESRLHQERHIARPSTQAAERSFQVLQKVLAVKSTHSL